MKLRSRILIVTFLISLFVQGLNCFLEIGFLANNLEENNLKKYSIIGTELKRKLDKSLIFGKPLANLNFTRLLGNIIPHDITNLYIIDTAGDIVFAHNRSDHQEALRMYPRFFQEKTRDTFRLFFPLSDRNTVKGNLVLIVSHDEIREKMLSLIRQSITTFLVIVVISLPVLYGLLTLFIVRPYTRFISGIMHRLDNKDYAGLDREGIHLSPMVTADRTLSRIKSGDWFSPENRAIYENMDVPDGDRESGEKKRHQELMTFMNTH